MRTSTMIAILALSTTLAVSGCGTSKGTGAATSSTSPPLVTTTTTGGAVNPNAPEVVAPGDIPDNQAFVPFASPTGVYSLSIPEGWARTETNGTVTFTDKYNSIQIRSLSTAAPPTVGSVRSAGLADVSSDPTFTGGTVGTVARKAGPGILATYTIGSAPNPVTAKKALLAVERYEFFHNGTLVVLTLSGAKGADNVDPWRKVTDSLTWK